MGVRDARRAQQALTAAVWIAAALLATGAGWSAPHGLVTVGALGLLAPAAVLARFVDGPVTLGSGEWTVQVSDLLLGAGLVLCPTGWWLLLLVVGTLVGQLQGQLPRAAVVRSTGQVAMTTAASLVLVRVAGVSGVPVAGAVLLAVGLAALLGHLTTAVGVAATVRRPLREVLRRRGLLPLGQSTANAATGSVLAAAVRASWAALLLLGLLIGLVLLLRGTRRRHAADLQMYAELVRGQESAAGRSVDVSAEVVLAAAARLLGGADCELLVRHPAGPVRFTGDEYGVRQRLPVPASEFDRSWVLGVLGSSTARTGVEAGRPYVAAAIGAGTPWALLAARRPAGAPGFGRADRRRLLALTDQARTWLAVSELTGWDTPYDTGLPAGLGESAEPALRSLRDASRRLSRLTQQWDSADPIGDVATEMHACQDAVTELMGAVIGRQVPRPGAAGLVRPVEWTSTGTRDDWSAP